VKAAAPQHDQTRPFKHAGRGRQQEIIMRILALAGVFGLAFVANAQIATQAEAFPVGPRYCAQYKGGAENCGFYSVRQCLAAISGNGGICTVASIQTEVVNVHTPRGTYRIIRDAID
jgi:hypothetical protein